MNDLAWVGAAIVGAVFVWAGATKLQARRAWAEQARVMGTPRWAIPVVPFLEVALGAALVMAWGFPLVPLAGMVLLVAFSALIGLNLLRGNRPACACFGARSARPISWIFVARNAVFVGLLLVALLVD